MGNDQGFEEGKVNSQLPLSTQSSLLLSRLYFGSRNIPFCGMVHLLRGAYRRYDILCRVLDVMFLWLERDHCRRSYERSITRALSMAEKSFEN